MHLHAPSTGWFIASLIIAVIAAIAALSPVPYVTTYCTWISTFAYIILAVSNLTPT